MALTTFSDLVQEARERVERDTRAAGLFEDGCGLEAGGTGAVAYADAVAVYLGLTRAVRSVGIGTNVLAPIVLVCPKAASASTATRREFLTALKAELPAALTHLQRGNIAPVDLAQAAIGPGMAVYTRYAKVLDAEGKPLSVREALALINQTLDEALAEQEGDFDADSRWALAWFEQSGFAEGEYGVAETLSKAKNTSVGGMVEAGILTSKGGKVRLLRPDELPASWDPAIAPRLTAWEVVHHLIRVLEADGESAAAKLVANLGRKAEVARELRGLRMPAASGVVISGAVEGLVDKAVLSRVVREAGGQVGPIYGKNGKAHLRRVLPGYNKAARFSLDAFKDGGFLCTCGTQRTGPERSAGSAATPAATMR